MEWPILLLLIVGSVVLLMVAGLPVAFGFVLVNMVGAFLLWGGETGLGQLILSMRESVSTFSLAPVILFVLMGEVVFHSGVAPKMMDTLDRWLGRLPGRLSFLAVASGTLLSTLTGNPMVSVAILGKTLLPEMELKGYKKPMTIGPLLGSAGLAMMVPPSEFAIVLGCIGRIPIGPILMAIIMPGLLLAALYAAYIIIRCKLQPSVAPPYELPPIPLSVKLIASVRYILPLAGVVFLVIGVILLGIATPSEAAATGTMACIVLAAIYRRLNWEVVKKSIAGTLEIGIMIFMIILGAKTFGQMLAFSGASSGLIKFATGLPVAPILTIIATQIIVMFMGTFMEGISILLITLPLFMPVVHALGFDPVWFAVLIMVNIQVAAISPPFGLTLFVMKGVAPPNTTMGDIYRASLPFIGLILIAFALVVAFPQIALWLPGLVRG